MSKYVKDFIKFIILNTIQNNLEFNPIQSNAHNEILDILQITTHGDSSNSS